jgi:hypothetical protein
MRANEFLAELWTQPYELTSRVIGPASREYYFDTKNNRSGRIVFDSSLDSDEGGTHIVLVIVHFYIDNLYHTSGKGDAVAIFSTVVAACRDYLRRYRPPVVTFETPDAKKRNLYVKMSGMFSDYVPYPNWRKDPVVGNEILDSLTDGVPEDAVVLHRRDYDPKKTRVYVDEQGVAEGLNEFAPDGFNGGDDEDEFSPEIARMAQEDGFTKGVSLADGATLERAIAINHWHSQHGGMYQQYFVRGFQAGRREKIRHDNKRYNLNLKLMKDGSIRRGEQGMAESFGGRKFVKPNFDFEWEEAERYPEFVKLGKDAWIELARKGRAVVITSAQDINNTDAADPDNFKLLHPEKQKRALAQLETGTVEMPIVAVYSDGRKELVSGNTRLTAMMARDGRATVWAFRVPGQQGTLNELAPDDSHSGTDDDRIIPWEQARAAIAQFAEDSNAQDFELRNNGQIAVTTWGPELGYPYSNFVMFISPHGDGLLSGMLFGLYEDGEFDVRQRFQVPCSYNGVDHAARVYMQVRS